VTRRRSRNWLEQESGSNALLAEGPAVFIPLGVRTSPAFRPLAQSVGLRGARPCPELAQSWPLTNECSA
jgi:hypothetical protein